MMQLGNSGPQNGFDDRKLWFNWMRAREGAH